MLAPVALLAQNTTHKATTGPAGQVNVFLGSSADHGQMTPAASYPFSTMSIAPQTYPKLHAGYEYAAKKFLGFTHNRFEGVGCQGSGGAILVKPFLGKNPQQSTLIKASESATPGFYTVAFTNQLTAAFAVYGNYGIHQYHFPKGQKGLYINLSHALSNGFVAEQHTVEGTAVSGWIEGGTTCGVGVYRLYYYLQCSQPVQWDSIGNHQLVATLPPTSTTTELRIAFSSVSTAYAKAAIGKESFEAVKKNSHNDWNTLLSRIKVSGDPQRSALFYSLLYRTLQSPYVISEKDGTYRAIDGSIQHAKNAVYNGWAIWDNYRTQLPLLSLAYPDKFDPIAKSIANLYKYGKQDYATMHEPSNTVRTEHAIVVLLDAYRKGIDIGLAGIADSLVSEAEKLDYTHPDKALESCYDAWALSELLAALHKDDLSKKYHDIAATYKAYWSKDFKDMTRPDVDRMQARGLYQGTIWQYRWAVPFDVKGLIQLAGGDSIYTAQLDHFFDNDLYNHANEPDLQAPLLYNTTSQPWKSQALIHQLAVDTVVQYYFNDNSRGIDPFIDRIYKNEPKAYIRTMDDDAGAMSAWFVLASCGIFPACVGTPVYYLSVPLFPSVEIKWNNGKTFTIHVAGFSQTNRYIKDVTLNGKKLNRNWLTHEEIMQGGQITITASATPQKEQGIKNTWITSMEDK